MKRYLVYKDSGAESFSSIPAHWEVIKLGRVGIFSASGIDKKSDEGELPVRMVNYTNVYGNSTLEIESSNSLMETTATADKIKEHRLRMGDILFTPSSETVEDIGLSAVITGDFQNTVYSYHLIRLRPHTRFSLDLGYKKYFCNNHAVLSQFSRVSVLASRGEGKKTALSKYVNQRFHIRFNYKDKLYIAHVRHDGTISFAKDSAEAKRLQGKIFTSPSLAAASITKKPANGWYSWKYERAPGDWVLLDALRK